MIIRAATLADADDLARLHEPCFADSWNSHSFRSLLGQSKVLALVAQPAAAAEPEGLIVIQVVADESEILTLATIPPARRSGLARALLKKASQEAAQRGASQMFLEVAEDNQAAFALYTGLGFTLNGRRRSYYRRSGGQDSDALMLRAHLPLKETWE